MAFQKGNIPHNKGVKGIFKHTEETKEKISRLNKGRKRSEEFKELMSEIAKNRIGKKNPMFGRKQSDRTKQKIREKALGREVSEETRLKLSEVGKGKILSETTKLKMRLAQLGEKSHNWNRVDCKCDYCGKITKKKPSRINNIEKHFCNIECRKLYMVGENSPNFGKPLSEERRRKIGLANWKGGRVKHSEGYIYVAKPEHPYAVNSYVLEHRLVMEEYLGRYLLPEEVVHHEGEKDDNRIENLRLFANNGEHNKYHQKLLREKISI